MNLYVSILNLALAKQNEKITPKDMDIDSRIELIEDTCFKAIQRIKRIINDDEFDNFDTIEEIVFILESIGAYGGNERGFG